MSDIVDDIVERLQVLVLTEKHQCNSPSCEEYQCVAYQGGEEITRLRAEVEALRKDAERYRYLVRDLISWEENEGQFAYIMEFGTLRGPSIDAAIDALMERK